MLSQIVVHYGEIGTKGANRPAFERSLENNLRSSLSDLGARVERGDQRCIVHVEKDEAGEAKKRIGRVFGVVWYAEVETAHLSYEGILKSAVRVLNEREKGSTFRVSVRRANKSFEMGSQEIARKLGEDVIRLLGLRVDLSHPQITLSVEVISDRALLHTEHLRGPGGLPVGTSGGVLHLLSGGIDSPVAAWLMMKRGCHPTYIHFYLAPSSGAVLESKVVELVRTLTDFAGDAKLVLVPFAPYQLATSDLPSEFEPVVFRRFMRMVAEALALKWDFVALSTGDNLAQVASQTLQNIACIDHGASVTTLRPLLGYDKEEIVQLAKQVGTYETSIEEYKDCCSIVSKHPRTRMRVEDVDEASRAFKFEELAASCLAMSDLVTVERGGRTTMTPLGPLLEDHAVEPLRSA